MEYIVYVKPNENNYITAINSSAFLTDITEWIEIDRGNCDKYHHAQNNYFDKPIMTMNRVYRYKLMDGKIIECTPEEIAEQELLNKPIETPSQSDIIEAQITYTAMMTDTLLLK